jgi:sec-independent protein translocase protein TatA
MFRSPLIDAAVVILAVLLIFGPKRLPTLGRGLGQGMREFKDGISGKAGSIEDEDEERPALNASNSAPAPAEGTRSEQASGSADRPTEVGSSEPRS